MLFIFCIGILISPILFVLIVAALIHLIAVPLGEAIRLMRDRCSLCNR